MKLISDIVRDKIIKAREQNKTKITLTDHEACELWAALESVELDAIIMKRNVKQALDAGFKNLDRHLRALKGGPYK